MNYSNDILHWRSLILSSQLLLGIDDCASNPCSNNATCIDHHQYYSCKCPQGYYGPRCSQGQLFKCGML